MSTIMPARRNPLRMLRARRFSSCAIAKATGPLAALLRDGGEPIDEVGHSITIYRRPPS
jgi:hypothetical protein